MSRRGDIVTSVPGGLQVRADPGPADPELDPEL